MSKLQEKPSALKKEHRTLPKMKFINFFSMFVSHFCIPVSGYGLRIRIQVQIQGHHWIRIRIHKTGFWFDSVVSDI